MKKHVNSRRKCIAVLVTLIMILSLVGCGGDAASNPGPEGDFACTQKDEGDGFEPIDDPFMSYGHIIFNPDGTGKWEYSLETDIEWKLKGDKLTVVEIYEGQEETFKGTWDGKKVVLGIWGIDYVFEKADASSSAADSTDSGDSTDAVDSADSVDSTLIGYYDCTGSDMQGTKLDSAGEWLELKDNGTGNWFLGATEDNFKWVLDGNEIKFDVEVDGQESTLKYTATLDGDDIVLDTGMLYYFSKNENGGTSETTTEPQGDSSQASNISWGDEPAGSIQMPSEWYGVAILTSCEGFDFEDKEYDIWGLIDFENGQPYIELYDVPDSKVYPILSMYIDEETTDWLTPIIGEDDAWIAVDLASGNEQALNKDFEWALLTQYIEGSLDIYHTYIDDNGGYADCRFFIREMGTGWNEEVDPLPPGYEEYKGGYSN